MTNGHVEVPPGITSLGKDELAKILSDLGMSAASVTSIAGPDVTEIKSATAPGKYPYGNQTFNGFSSLVSVSFPALTIIGDWAFMAGDNLDMPCPLTDLDCPAATSIGMGAFAYCSSLTSIHCPAATRIADIAFYSCTSLESVDLPAVTSIEGEPTQGANSTFGRCSRLKYINIPAVEIIPKWTFRGCPLTAFDFLAVVSIGEGAFEGCTSLTSAKMPVVAYIGAGAFNKCTSLTSVEVPAKAFIGVRAFAGCPSLENPPMAANGERCRVACKECRTRAAWASAAVVCFPIWFPFIAYKTRCFTRKWFLG